MEFYGLHVKMALNGWIVHVGCQTIVFTSQAEMFGWFIKYFENPQRAMAKFIAHSCNKEAFRQQIQGIPTEAQLAEQEIQERDRESRKSVHAREAGVGFATYERDLRASQQYMADSINRDIMSDAAAPSNPPPARDDHQ